MKWLDLKQRVLNRHNMCKDTVVRVRDIQLRGMPAYVPNATHPTLAIKVGNIAIDYATKQGLSSLLDRVGVPAAFFAKCTPALRAEILKEFLINNANQSLLLRTMATTEGTMLRFAGSPKYDIYNDVDAVGALSRYVHDDQLMRRVFIDHDRTEFMILLTTEPLKVVRDFGIALRIVNSETGCSQLRVDVILFELVCTNGLIVPRRILPGFKRAHVKSSTVPQLVEFMDDFLPRVGSIAEQITQRLQELRIAKAGDIIQKLLDIKGLPKTAFDNVNLVLPSYGDTALDAISAITEVARDTENLDVRERLQLLAGELAF